MRHRTSHITSSLGHHLSVRPEHAIDGLHYVGLIDGYRCLSRPTREAAVEALLRRFAHTVLAA